MSELNLTHSNGNQVKLTTPDTLAANRTFKLPGADGTAGQVLMTDGNGNLSFVDLPYSVYDKWVGSTTTTGNQNPFTDWVRHDYTGPLLGTGMSHSSGTFTFPKTGVYLVRFNADMYNTSNYERTIDCDIMYTTNNSSYNLLQNSSGNVHNIGSYNIHTTVQVQGMLDVTDTSNVKVQFKITAYNNASSLKAQGYGANGGYTYVDFTRVADT